MQRDVVAAGVLLLIMFAGQCGQSNGHRERDSPPPAPSEVEVRMAATHQQAVAQWSRERARSASLEGEVANGRGTVGVLSITVVILASALTVLVIIRSQKGEPRGFAELLNTERAQVHPLLQATDDGLPVGTLARVAAVVLLIGQAPRPQLRGGERLNQTPMHTGICPRPHRGLRCME